MDLKTQLEKLKALRQQEEEIKAQIEKARENAVVNQNEFAVQARQEIERIRKTAQERAEEISKAEEDLRAAKEKMAEVKEQMRNLRQTAYDLGLGEPEWLRLQVLVSGELAPTTQGRKPSAD